MSQNPVCGIQILSSPHSIKTYLSNVTSEKSANCESCVNGVSCANSDHSPESAHSLAAPESEIIPAL